MMAVALFRMAAVEMGLKIAVGTFRMTAVGMVRMTRSGWMGGAVALGFEEGLQDEDGGDLIDDSLARAAVGGVAGVVKLAMGLGGGEALIPEMDGDAGFSGEGGGKLLRLGGLGALIARHVERIAHNDVGAGVLAEEAA